MRGSRAGAMALAVAALLAIGCGDSGEANPGDAKKAAAAALRSSGPMDVKVAITKSGYRPKTVRVPAGAKVTWVNVSAEKATAENFGDRRHPPFDTHTIYRGQSKSVVFDRPGRYEYFSSYDPETFSGILVVEPAAGSGDDRGGS